MPGRVGDRLLLKAATLSDAGPRRDPIIRRPFFGVSSMIFVRIDIQRTMLPSGPAWAQGSARDHKLQLKYPYSNRRIRANQIRTLAPVPPH